MDDPIDLRLIFFGSALASVAVFYFGALILFRTIWRFR